MLGLICIFHDAGHLDDVTYRSSESDAKGNPAFLLLMFMHTVPEYPAPQRTNVDQTIPRPSALAHAEALILASALRSSNRLCFFNRMTLNLSKSVRDRRRSCCSCFFAQLPAFHFESISAFSHALLTAPVRAPRGSFSMTRGVRRVLEKETVVRAVASLGSAEGPSTRACNASQFSLRVHPQDCHPCYGQRTRLWSMISTMVARVPVSSLRTRPTSTRRQELAPIWISDMVNDF